MAPFLLQTDGFRQLNLCTLQIICVQSLLLLEVPQGQPGEFKKKKNKKLTQTAKSLLLVEYLHACCTLQKVSQTSIQYQSCRLNKANPNLEAKSATYYAACRGTRYQQWRRCEEEPPSASCLCMQQRPLTCIPATTCRDL